MSALGSGLHFQCRRGLVWDATVVDTFAQGHQAYKDSARQAGFAATKAEAAKCQKYHDLKSNYHFQPVAIETTGQYGKSTSPFLSGLTKKLVDVSGDPRERQWLHQCLSLAVVRENAASILACVCKFDLILPVLFLAAFNILTTITAYHLPLYRCVAIAFQILVLSVRFIVPSVVQCYLVHWLNILSIAWPVMRVQRGFVINIA